MTQATSKLLTHCGARTVSLEELEKVPVPEGTKTWFPIAHGEVVKTVGRSLEEAGFSTTNARYALARNDARMFATLDLTRWSLLNAFTTVLGGRQKTNPQAFALATMKLNHLIAPAETEAPNGQAA